MSKRTILTDEDQNFETTNETVEIIENPVNEDSEQPELTEEEKENINPMEETHQDPVNEDSEQPRSKTGKVVNCKYVRVRNLPSLDSRVIDQMEVGQTAEILVGSTNGFYKIKTDNGLIGYIASNYFKEE